jgi:hypothetical protein
MYYILEGTTNDTGEQHLPAAAVQNHERGHILLTAKSNVHAKHHARCNSPDDIISLSVGH